MTAQSGQASETSTAEASTSAATANATPGPLSGAGPRLIFAAAINDGDPENLWAASPDGGAPARLTTDMAWAFSVGPTDADGNTPIATIASPDTTVRNLTLKMIALPGGKIETITPLTSSETAFTNQDPNDSNSNYWQVSSIADAITSKVSSTQNAISNSVAWSPDGRWVAFVGAMEGPSADVYSYEVATGKIRQLTSGADQAFQLLWSPDSRWILHTAQQQFERSGGEFEAATGIWAAAPDGSAVNKLEGARASEFLGWVDDHTLAVEGGPRMGPGGDLRLINIATSTITDLAPACYGDAVYSPQHRSYLVMMPTDLNTLCPNAGDWKPGLYLVTNGARTLIPDLDVFDLQWSSVFDVFFATKHDNRVVAISPSGKVMPDFAATLPSLSVVASSDGKLRAWYNGNSLYVASGPDFKPIQVPGTFYSRRQVLVWSK